MASYGSEGQSRVPWCPALAGRLAVFPCLSRRAHAHFHLLCLQEEFGYNAETQKLLSKNGETLLGAVNFFVSSINTLVNKTMEDTLMTVKQYETARWGLFPCIPR